ncbi:hypothetical protein ACHHYP_02675 [Achlya hypogyna]|uniref:Uncharacterized protein n=1 Tax=Achlya hypogyna TaxID=1202772 RepID=A0A1V9Z5T0_ACHHY|nr:hypothetical protein ACHHYP_02675 [Achlya hypogyna]
MKRLLRPSSKNDVTAHESSPTTTPNGASHLVRLGLFSKVQSLATQTFKFRGPLPTPKANSTSPPVARPAREQPRRRFALPAALIKPTKMLNKLIQSMVADPLQAASKMKALAKRLWFAKPAAAAGGGQDRAKEPIDIANRMRAWAASAKAHIAHLHRRRALLHGYAVAEAGQIIDATVHIVVHKAQRAAHESRSAAATMIQACWRAHAARTKQRRDDKQFFVDAMRAMVLRSLCRRLVPPFVAAILERGLQCMAARTLQRVWRGHKGRQRARARRRRLRRQALAAAREAARLAKRRALLAPPEDTERLAAIKRAWAREDFRPTSNEPHRRLLARHKTLIPLPTQMPPQGALVARLSVPKWNRLHAHVNPRSCWVAVPIHVETHVAKDNLRPVSRILKRHYDLQYDWIPAGLLRPTTDLPRPITYEEKVQQMSPSRASPLRRAVSVSKGVTLAPVASKARLK